MRSKEKFTEDLKVDDGKKRTTALQTIQKYLNTFKSCLNPFENKLTYAFTGEKYKCTKDDRREFVLLAADGIIDVLKDEYPEHCKVLQVYFYDPMVQDSSDLEKFFIRCQAFDKEVTRIIASIQDLNEIKQKVGKLDQNIEPK